MTGGIFPNASFITQHRDAKFDKPKRGGDKSAVAFGVAYHSTLSRWNLHRFYGGASKILGPI